jgi:hypothetical protein
VSYIEFKLDESIVTVPETARDAFNVVVIFGGLHYATPAWMQSQTPADIMEKALVVFAPFRVEYPTVIKKLGPFLDGHKLKTTGLAGASVLGFSRGGINALDAYSASHKFIGLMDPSFRKSHTKRTYSRNVAMLWGSRGMVSLFGESGYLELAAAITQGGGFAERRNLAHDKFPRVFMEKFKSHLT